MHCCLWFRSVFRVRGPWPKRYGYHLSIIFNNIIYIIYSINNIINNNIIINNIIINNVLLTLLY